MSTVTTTLKPRMDHPVMVVPDAMAALQALGTALADCGVPHRTVELVNFRASQINGCAVCLEGGAREARRNGETDDRLLVLSGWREAPFFTDAERAALALTEAVTRLADRAEAVPDEVWADAAADYDERALAGLVLQIANINIWNRLNVATRQVAGTYTW